MKNKGSKYGPICPEANASKIFDAANCPEVSVFIKGTDAAMTTFEVSVNATGSESVDEIFLLIELSSTPKSFMSTDTAVSVIPTNASDVFGVHVASGAAVGDPAKKFEVFGLVDTKFTAICFETATCSKCSGSCDNFLNGKSASLKLETFLEPTNKYRAEAVVEHACGRAQELQTAGGLKETVQYTCGWDGKWTPHPGLPPPTCVCKGENYSRADGHLFLIFYCTS